MAVQRERICTFQVFGIRTESYEGEVQRRKMWITYLSDPRLRRHPRPVPRLTLVMGRPTHLELSIGLLDGVPIPAGVQIVSWLVLMTTESEPLIIRALHG